jgi:3-methyladenine DNA glycosylase AlkD
LKKQGQSPVPRTHTFETVMMGLRSHRNPKNIAGMARFGISTKNTYGISVSVLRATAKEIGKNHLLAGKLWASGVHEARVLASMIDDPALVTGQQMDQWAREFDSWDVCDQCCGNLFVKTKHAYEKALEWSSADQEFVKRAGYALMAYLAVHDTNADDKTLAHFLPIIKKGSDDERNFVKKSVNWALRQIGKRNLQLNRMAVKTAKEIGELESKSAKWIAADALRELQSETILSRLKND